MFGIV
jgi:DNA-binding transcriptional LysR family regulator